MQDSQIIRTEYSDVMKKSYIDYAMSVIIARALPDVRDGLKPVQRRTLYDMHEQVPLFSSLVTGISVVIRIPPAQPVVRIPSSSESMLISL